MKLATTLGDGDQKVRDCVESPLPADSVEKQRVAGAESDDLSWPQTPF